MIIIGAGASGLLASILLAKKGVEVTILEKEKKLARKLRVTGNGKCNITNLDISDLYFHSNNPELIKNFIFDYETIEKTFLSIGIPFINKDKRVFPMSLEANGVADILEFNAKKLGVKIINECEVYNIKKGFVLETSKGEFKTDKLVIASGSKAGRVAGSDDLLEIIKNLGHNVYERYPSLVQFITEEDFTKCSGVKIKAKLSLYSNGDLINETYGDLLFTNYGISGLSVLDISVGVAKRLKNYEYLEVSVDFFSEYSKQKLKNLILSIKDDNKPLGMILRGILPAKLIPFILKKADINSLNQKEINKLVYTLKNFKIEIIDTKDYKNAEVMSGGVDISEIDNLMQSKIVKNLYFLGEILDIDGDRGGYNLHFAWSSAIRLSEGFK